jgi:hypothetical protein
MRTLRPGAAVMCSVDSQFRLRQQNLINNLNDAVGLVDVEDGYLRGSAFGIDHFNRHSGHFERQIRAVDRGGASRFHCLS